MKTPFFYLLWQRFYVTALVALASAAFITLMAGWHYYLRDDLNAGTVGPYVLMIPATAVNAVVCWCIMQLARKACISSNSLLASGEWVTGPKERPVFVTSVSPLMNENVISFLTLTVLPALYVLALQQGWGPAPMVILALYAGSSIAYTLSEVSTINNQGLAVAQRKVLESGEPLRTLEDGTSEIGVRVKGSSSISWVPDDAQRRQKLYAIKLEALTRQKAPEKVQSYGHFDGVDVM